MHSGMFLRSLILFFISMTYFRPNMGNVLIRRDNDETEYTNFTTYVENSCLEVFSCPKTSIDATDQEGNFFLRENFFTDYCKYTQELLDCAKELDIFNDTDCADQRKFLSIFTTTETSLCINPIYPLIQELRPCLNSIFMKLDNYSQILRPLMKPADHDFTTNNLSKESFCTTYDQILDETVKEFRSCPLSSVQWTSQNIKLLRKNYYPIVTGKTPPFQCSDSDS
ncbi:uncharacterized protein LOC133203643 [Saccostrea echinata]|uniref:uncharacterized protein LOC133203643 n=1 Tax=Saccostrea echinata TaxID=191078 RepID=UPI002A8080EC|nr:uncharacterized protein LOC133203643 [Saccostrea echinata]